MAELKEDSIRSQVSALIKGQSDITFCNACIQNMLGIRSLSAASDATRSLAKGGVVLGFARSIGKCGVCEQRRMVIYAVRPIDCGWTALASVRFLGPSQPQSMRKRDAARMAQLRNTAVRMARRARKMNIEAVRLFNKAKEAYERAMRKEHRE